MKKCRTDFYSVHGESCVQCHVCPNQCKLKPGQRGWCGAFVCNDGGLYSTVYGKTSGVCVDPIEKKPLNQFLPGTRTLSLGTIGCNLSCKFCQNWDISLNRQRESALRDAPPHALVNAAIENDCASIACTYNEPTIFIDYCLDIAKEAHANDLTMVAVTNGYIQGKAREMFYNAFDAANIDLKAFTEGFYKKLCGAALSPILDTLRYIHNETHVWLEITTLLIPGENDSESELKAMVDWILTHLGPDVPLHLTAFHPQFEMTDTPSTSAATVIRAREQAMRQGLRYVYTGNIHYPEGEVTLCPNCTAPVIGRDRYRLDIWGLRDGCCMACGERIAGVLVEERKAEG